ncbi:MAG: V-type ATPase subunit [Candidatus Bathyarchaeia archaeon]|jgi:vacuolar-type H+-ATPase subunit C/Vma6
MQTTKYASVLPKIGAERSKLLSEAKLKSLAESRSLDEVASQLRDTPYQEQFSHLTPPLTGRKLERCLNENLIETYLRIIKYSPPRAVRYLDLYLWRIEAENVKTLIRAANAQLPAEQRLGRIYLSVEKYFDHVTLMEDAAKAPTVAQVVQTFKGTEFGPALALGLKSFQETGSAIMFDIYVDTLFHEKFYKTYKGLPRREKSHAALYARLGIDGFVLFTLLRAKNLNYDPNWLRLTVPKNTFKLGKKEVEGIITALNFDAALQIVQKTEYAEYFERALDQAPENVVAKAEKAFRNTLLQHALRNKIREIFNIGSTLGFITIKEAEVHNLSAISLGVEGGMKPEVIRNQLQI